MAIPVDFIALLGLQQSLTPSRNNGFLNMFKLMQKKSLELLLQQQQHAAATAPGAATRVPGAAGAGVPPTAAAASSSSSANGSSSGASTSSSAASAGAPSAASAAAAAASSTPATDSIRRKLTERLVPARLTIQNESHRHAGHAGHIGSAAGTGETHFNVSTLAGTSVGCSKGAQRVLKGC